MKNSFINSFEINKILGTKLKEIHFSGASIDSRVIKKNNIFFALKGKNTDGHSYLEMAFKRGATLAFVKKRQKNIKGHQIKVNNVHSAMVKLAKYYRSNLRGKILAITGSIGKTGTKDALFNIIPKKHRVFHSRKSFNNIIGLPLEILNMSKKDDYGIFELGMNHKNELSKLTRILQPDIACILNISYVHGGNFNSIRDIALAKSEILNSSSNLKSIILNRDDKFFSLMKKEAKKNYDKPIISFGKSKYSDIQLEGVIRYKNSLMLNISINNDKKFKFKLPFTHEHLISNSLAIISCLKSMKLKTNYIKNYSKVNLTSGRGNIIKTKIGNKNVYILDHSYNASPESFRSTLTSFNNYEHKKKIYIIGEMFELGKKSYFYHHALFKFIKSFNPEYFFLIGKQFKFVKDMKIDNKYSFFENVEDLIKKFNYDICSNSIIYIKGSNAVGLNKFINHLKKK